MHNFLGLGIGIGRFVLILVGFYFVVRLAVKKGIEEYYKENKKALNHCMWLGAIPKIGEYLILTNIKYSRFYFVQVSLTYSSYHGCFVFTR